MYLVFNKPDVYLDSSWLFNKRFGCHGNVRVVLNYSII